MPNKPQVRDILNVRVNQHSQVTDASVRKMEYCAIVGPKTYKNIDIIHLLIL
jgi:hypothetical protein